MSVYCYRCGQRLAGGARHCPSCGAAIFYDENGLRKEGDPSASDYINEEVRNESQSYESGQAAYDQQQTWQQPGQNGSWQQGTHQNWQQGQNAGWQTGGQNGTWQQGGWQNPWQPYAEAGANSKAEGYARTSMILGIVSAVLCLFMPFLGLPAAIAALVLGIMGQKAVVNKGKAVAGLVLGIIFLILNGMVVAFTVYYIAHPELLDRLLQQLSLSGR